MADVSTWSSTAASNNSASPDGFPEGMAPSGVNDAAREVMAAVATWYADHAWVLRGRASAGQAGTQHTVAYGSATTFTTSAGDGDTTAIYQAGRRIKAEVTAGTVVGRITGSTGNPTTVTVELDSGSLDSGLDQVYLGPETTNIPIDISGVARAGGAWRVAAQYTPSATSSQDVTDLDQSSDHIFLIRKVLPASDADVFQLRTSPDSGGSPTIDSTSGDYEWSLLGAVSNSGSAAINNNSSDTEIHLHHNCGNVGSLENGLSGYVYIENPGDSGDVTVVHSVLWARDDGGVMAWRQGVGSRASAAVVQAVRFFFASGNITSGTIDHYTRPVQ